MILAAFAFQRFQELIYHSNPIISLANVQDFYTAADKFNATDNGFRVAFGVNHFRTFEALDSEEYVQFQVKLTVGLNQKQLYSDFISFHKCTDEDWDKFYPPRPSDVKFFNHAKKNMGFYCFDED